MSWVGEDRTVQALPWLLVCIIVFKSVGVLIWIRGTVVVLFDRMSRALHNLLMPLPINGVLALCPKGSLVLFP